MRIGIDIDGVLTDEQRYELDYGSAFFAQRNIPYKIHDDIYDGKEIFEVSQEEYDAFWREHIYHYSENISIRPFARDIIKKLVEENYEIYIITSRTYTTYENENKEKMQNIVKDWLKRNDVQYKDIIFSREKDKICEQLNIDIMIEDKPENINIISKNIPVICFNVEYNKKCTGENIYRAFSWYDIYSKIKEIENKNKIVIFDWGGVIESHKEGEYNIFKSTIEMMRKLNVDVNKIDVIEEYTNCNNDENGIYISCQSAEHECESWFERVKKKFNLQCDLKEFAKVYDEEKGKVVYYKDVIETAKKLKKYCKIGILSNLMFLDKERLDKQVKLKDFDYVWLSFELNCRKPDDKIYEIVEKDCKIKPSNILFIDDRSDNIEEAKTRGWNTCLATGHELDKIKDSINNFLNI